jgi:putative oxidoreductase
MRQLQKYQEHAYAAMRIVFGLMFAFHGMQKTLGIMSEFHAPLMSQMGLGGVIELVGGLMMALGVKTRWAAFLASGTMAVAYFQFHWKLAMGSAFFPGINKGELAVAYCFAFLYFACKGSGRLALKPD